MTTATDARPAGVLEHIDPNAIIIEANVRPSEPVTKEFVASIREYGVLTPVYGRRDEHGNILVRAGQRRTLGAREAAIATMPVYVIDGDESTTRRIIEQLIENEHRKDLSDADRAAAWQQLSFEGMSPAAIAKKTGTKTDRVKQGLAVVENASASSAIVEHQLDLEQAATLIEFEDDPEVTADLIAVAKEEPDQFHHAAQRARDERERKQKREQAEAEAAEQGFAILETHPRWDEPTIAPLYELRDPEGERVTPESIANLDGASAIVRSVYGGEASIDYYLAGWKEHDYTRPNSTSGGGSNSGPMTDEQKAERKILIANNKAWASAETVRREWLVEFMSRKTLPKDAAQFIARGLTTHRGDVYREMQAGNPLAHTLLGIDPGSGWRADKLAEVIEATPAKAQHVSLAIVLGGTEENTDKGAWRYPSEDKGAYFAQLAKWGYTLSEVEQIVIDGAAARKAERDERAAQAEPVEQDEDEVEPHDDLDDGE
ncbi:ParB N-terminal domain-containing protein [Streptomyces sp. ISL-90]|nr:ParB N-terminal domain-containing protein [Streptomyces sp. ISL-90]